jgi:hypothetical protein
VKLVSIRDEELPERLVLLRFGVNTLSDASLARLCEESFARMGLNAFSVFGLPPGGYDELARLVPIFVHRRQFLEASAEDVIDAGYSLLPTNANPHWSVIVPAPTPHHCGIIRGLFSGPITNPLWLGAEA